MSYQDGVAFISAYNKRPKRNCLDPHKPTNHLGDFAISYYYWIHNMLYGAGDGTRTRNLLITNQLLYQLSYASLPYKFLISSKILLNSLSSEFSALFFT